MKAHIRVGADSGLAHAITGTAANVNDVIQRQGLLLDKQAVALPPRSTKAQRSRETEVLSWLAKGKTNRDIGDILGLSQRTVNKHLEHVFEKLGVETRAAAVRWRVFEDCR